MKYLDKSNMPKRMWSEDEATIAEMLPHLLRVLKIADSTLVDMQLDVSDQYETYVNLIFSNGYVKQAYITADSPRAALTDIIMKWRI